MKVVNLLLFTYSLISLTAAVTQPAIVNTAPPQTIPQWCDSVEMAYRVSVNTQSIDFWHRLRMLEIEIQESKLLYRAEIKPSPTDQIYFLTVTQ